MPVSPNLVGQRFGRLIVARADGYRGAKRTWLCECECGGTTVAPTSYLREGSVRSCGCLLSGPTAVNARHGHSSRSSGPSPTYNSWRAMLDRCSSPGHSHFKHYGARGITVCDRWLSFDNFLADMGERPAGRTLDRIDVNGNYEPANCRWATASEQARNKRPRVRGTKSGPSMVDEILAGEGGANV